MLCMPSNCQRPFSYQTRTLSIFVFCPLSREKKGLYLREVYRIWQVVTVTWINHNVGTQKSWATGCKYKHRCTKHFNTERALHLRTPLFQTFPLECEICSACISVIKSNFVFLSRSGGILPCGSDISVRIPNARDWWQAFQTSSRHQCGAFIFSLYFLYSVHYCIRTLYI